MKTIKSLLVYILFLTIASVATAQQEHVVRAVYIKPSDSPPPLPATLSKYRNMIKGIQRFYATEMENHGYGRKTFALETDDIGWPIITIVNSRYNKQQYAKDTDSLAVKDLLENNFKTEENLYVVVVGGIELVNNVHGGLAHMGDGMSCGGCRGAAVLAEGYRSFSFRIMAHELGHVFGLSHISHPTQSFLMGGGREDEEHPLADYEAHWLNVHPYFNNKAYNWKGSIPEVTDIHTPEVIGNSWVKFSVDIEGKNNLHQAQLVKHQNVEVIAWHILSSQHDTAEFLVKREDLTGVVDTWIHFIDSHGNKAIKYMSVDIPQQYENTQPPEIDQNITYLTLRSEHPKALTPINRSWQWARRSKYLWEKRPHEEEDSIPDGAVHPTRHVEEPYRNWQWFIYSHANSVIAWDISDKEYDKLDTYLYLPNPCGNVASIDITFLADWNEIYNSGELRRKDQGKHISFEIPKDTRILSFEVFDLDDPGCDHYILAHPYLTYTPVSGAPSKQVFKAATTWANLKRQ